MNGLGFRSPSAVHLPTKNPSFLFSGPGAGFPAGASESAGTIDSAAAARSAAADARTGRSVDAGRTADAGRAAGAGRVDVICLLRDGWSIVGQPNDRGRSSRGVEEVRTRP